MAEDTGIEDLDEPTGIPSENTPNEIIFNKKKEAANPAQQTENMEVHHHAHHNGKKNWKSYFWEFLMLFLAVTLSFFNIGQKRTHFPYSHLTILFLYY